MIEIFEPIRKTVRKLTKAPTRAFRSGRILELKDAQEKATRRTKNLNKHKARVSNLIEARKNYALEKATLTKKLESYETHTKAIEPFKEAQQEFVSKREKLETQIKNAKDSSEKKNLELELIKLQEAHKITINKFLNPIKQSHVNTNVVSPDILLKQKSADVESSLSALSKRIDMRKELANTELSKKIDKLGKKEAVQNKELIKATERLNYKLKKSRRNADKFTKYMSTHKITGFAAEAATYFRDNPESSTKDFINSLGPDGLKKFKSFRYKTAGLEAKANFIRSRVLYENAHENANTIKTKAEKKLLEDPTTAEEFAGNKDEEGKEKEEKNKGKGQGNKGAKLTREAKPIDEVKKSISELNQKFYNDMNTINSINSTNEKDIVKKQAIESKKKILLAKLFTKYKLDLNNIKNELGIDQTFGSIYTAEEKIDGNVLDNITGSDGLNFFKDHFINPESQVELHESMGIDTSKETTETKNLKEPTKTLEELEANFKDVELKNGMDFILNEKMVENNIEKNLNKYFQDLVEELENKSPDEEKIKKTKDIIKNLELKKKEFTEIEGYIESHKAEYANKDTTAERKQELLGLIAHQSELLLRVKAHSIQLNEATTETAPA